MVRILKFVSLILMFISANIFGQNINLSASTDTTDYLVGDYIYFTIKAEYEEGIRVSPPSLTDRMGQLEVIKVLPVTFEDEKNEQQFNYIISGYDSARIIIPPIPITYFTDASSEPQTTETNEVEIFIHTLQVNTSEEIKDVKQPIRIPIDWIFWLTLLLIFCLLVLIGYFLYKKFKKPNQEERIIRKSPPTPIHIIALKALDKLSEQKLWQQGKIKEYHSEITEIIRRYFEDRYHFNSLEMTTAQSMVVLNRVMDNQKIIETTAKFLENADLVKFAKFKPLPSVNEEMMKQAYLIVERTRQEEKQTVEMSNV